MKKVEKHLIKSNHQWFEYCQEVTTCSRQLFNSAQYSQRQSFFYGWGSLNLSELDVKFKQHKSYKALPAKVSQLILKQSSDSWCSYFLALKAYKKDPTKFTGRPKHPGFALEYNLIKFNNQAISKTAFRKGFIQPSMSLIKIPVKPGLKFENLCEVRIVPKVGGFVIEVVYELEEEIKYECNNKAAAIDIGLDNLATIAFSDNTQPLVINGKPLKSENQFYNKQIAKYRGLLKSSNQYTSKRIQNIVRNRNQFVESYLHQVSKLLVKELLKEGVSHVSIGKNEQWKTKLKLGKKTNQKFTQIPHARFIQMLTSKLEEVGIKVKVAEESYTSKASAFDWDNIPTFNPNNKIKYKFSGKRVSRSWYKTKDGILIHADVNGAFNIGRKCNPELFTERDRGCLVVHPRRITPLFRRVFVKRVVA